MQVSLVRWLNFTIACSLCPADLPKFNFSVGSVKTRF